MLFGMNLEAELDGCDGKTAREVERKRQRVLDRWLGVEQKFREPPGAGMREQRMKGR